jgi:hypothetical protein
MRWPQWIGWRFVAAQYQIPLSAAVLGLMAVAGWWTAVRRGGSLGSREAAGAAGAVLIPLFFYALGCLGYFRQVFHFRQFMWALVPAAAWELQRRGALLRLTTAALWAPGVLTMFRYALLSASTAPALATVSLPSGGTIVAAPELAQRIAFLQHFVGAEAPGQPIVLLAGAGGWYGAYGIPHATRHVWFEGFDVIRPYEQQAFIEAFDRTAALIACDRTPRSWPLAAGLPVLPFPPAVSEAIAPRLVLWTSGAGCRVYRIR